MSATTFEVGDRVLIGGIAPCEGLIVAIRDGLPEVRPDGHEQAERFDWTRLRPIPPQRFRKRPVVIEAMCWDGSLRSIRSVARWVNGHDQEQGHDDPTLTFTTIVDGIKRPVVRDVLIETLEGPMGASTGDWIIKGVKGEFYACKPDVFGMTYEVDDARPDGASRPIPKEAGS